MKMPSSGTGSSSARMETTLKLTKVLIALLCLATVMFLIAYNKYLTHDTSDYPPSIKFQQKIPNPLTTRTNRSNGIDTRNLQAGLSPKKYSEKEFAIYIDNGTCAISMESINKSFIAESEVCKFQTLDPFHPDIMKVLEHVTSLNCTGRLFTEYENNLLRLLDDVSEEHLVAEVIAKPIIRVTEQKNAMGEQTSLDLKNREANMSGDFLEVTVRFKNGSIQTDLHASISEIHEVAQRKEVHTSPLNIMILIFDGTSAAHFQRMLPKTFDFLNNELDSNLFNGYSIVGESTYPAMTALVTGNSVEENCRQFREGRRGNVNASQIDEWPFIFKELKNSGFATMWSEDQPGLGAFDYRLKGFKDQPVDHYGRTLWKGHVGLCLGSQPQYQLQLKYMKSYKKSYPGKRKFGLTFFSDLCHRKANLVSAADSGLLAFFNSIKDANLLNDTMFITMADHGGRFGVLRQSSQGKLEHRLPFLSVTLPSWFKKKYPGHMAGLIRNTRIITSPFDLHATFKHLLTFPDKPTAEADGVGRSIFEPFPVDRSCHDAGIPEQYCPCIRWQSIDISHPHVPKGAKVALSYINELLMSYRMTDTLCHKLHLKAIFEAYQKIPSRETYLNLHSDNSTCSYQIKFQTTPGDGLFEAFLRASTSGDFKIFGEIDRVNMYGDQPRCVAKDLPYMRPYCLCKNQ